MESEFFIDGKKYISSGRAVEKSGYNQDYIGQLCRHSKLPAKLVGRTWFVSEEALDGYVESRRNSSKNHKPICKVLSAALEALPETKVQENVLPQNHVAVNIDRSSKNKSDDFENNVAETEKLSQGNSAEKIGADIASIPFKKILPVFAGLVIVGSAAYFFVTKPQIINNIQETTKQSATQIFGSAKQTSLVIKNNTQKTVDNIQEAVGQSSVKILGAAKQTSSVIVSGVKIPVEVSASLVRSTTSPLVIAVTSATRFSQWSRIVSLDLFKAAGTLPQQLTRGVTGFASISNFVLDKSSVGLRDLTIVTTKPLVRGVRYVSEIQSSIGKTFAYTTTRSKLLQNELSAKTSSFGANVFGGYDNFIQGAVPLIAGTSDKVFVYPHKLFSGMTSFVTATRFGVEEVFQNLAITAVKTERSISQGLDVAATFSYDRAVAIFNAPKSLARATAGVWNSVGLPIRGVEKLSNLAAVGENAVANQDSSFKARINHWGETLAGALDHEFSLISDQLLLGWQTLHGGLLALYDSSLNIIVSRTASRSESVPTNTPSAPSMPTKETGSGAFVVVPKDNQASVAETVNNIKQSFSDSVEVKPSPDGGSGVITPVFKSGLGKQYIYVLVPIKGQ